MNGSPTLPPGIKHISQFKRPNSKSPRECGELIKIQTVLQRIIHEPLLQIDGKGEMLPVPAREIAQCSKQWGDLENLRMIKMGFGRPKSVEAKNERKSDKRGNRKPASSYEEPAIVPNPVPVPPHTSETPTPQEQKAQ